ncbi:MAG: BA14K family protein [Pseudomonadota bacterium]
MFMSENSNKRRLIRLVAGVASASLLTASTATPAAAQDAPRVITADELEFEQQRIERLERIERREFRRAQRAQNVGGGDYIQTPNGDYVLIEDRRFRKGLRAGHRVDGRGVYGRRAGRQIDAPVIVERNNNRNGAIAAGIIGLAAGAIIANEFGRNNRRNQHVQVTRPPQYEPPIPVRRIDRVPLSQLRAQQTQVTHSTRSNGWIGSREWLRHCTAKYRSFNPRTGQFLSYSGQYKLCR